LLLINNTLLNLLFVFFEQANPPAFILNYKNCFGGAAASLWFSIAI